MSGEGESGCWPESTDVDAEAFVWYARGQVDEFMNRPDSAVECFLKSLASAESPELLCALNKLLHDAGLIDEADVAMRRAWSVGAAIPMVVLLWGYWNMDHGDRREAERVFRSILQDGSDDEGVKSELASIVYGRARMRLQEGLRSEAVELFQEAWGLERNGHTAYHLALLYRESGAQQEARELMREAYKEAPNSNKIATAWAEMLFDIGHVEEARSVLDQIFGRSPEYGPAVRLSQKLPKDDHPEVVA